MEPRIVEIRVGRPSQGFPLRKEYSRNRAGRTFTGRKLYMVVDDETFTTEANEDLITEAQLAAVRADPVFGVMDPYVEKPAEDDMSVLEPFRRRAAEVRERIEGMKPRPAELQDWMKPKGPRLAKVSRPKFEAPPPPSPEKIAETKEEEQRRIKASQRTLVTNTETDDDKPSGKSRKAR